MRPFFFFISANSIDSLSSSLFNFERGSAPPISLSSPELGAAESDDCEEYVRNSYSSSELLYERNLNRFNGYSNEAGENSSSEAQKIAIYAMDRKNSLRRSPIIIRSRRSDDRSEEMSIFSDSDSVRSVVDLCGTRTNADSSFASLADSIEEECTSLKSAEESDGGGKSSSSSSPVQIFGNGKRALEHDASSAFFSTAVYDDEYLSDRRPSSSSSSSLSPDRHRSKSASPSAADKKTEDATPPPDTCTFAEFVTSIGGVRTGSDHHDDDDDDGTVVEGRSFTAVDGGGGGASSSYRPRDGIPKYVMLPNPYYREMRPDCSADRVKLLRLSSDTDGTVVPPEIPGRRDASECVPVTGARLPVITVTETDVGDGDGDGGSPKSFLKKIFVPSLQAAANASERDCVPAAKTEFAETVAVVKHYGDIVERYSGIAGKKSAAKTYYLDFEQLQRMAAAAEEDEPVVEPDGAESDGTRESDDVLEDDDPTTYDDGVDGYDPAAAVVEDDSPRLQMAVAFRETAAARPPEAIPYLKVFGNLSLALFGYWLYTCKDERLSVPVFGFLFFRFFKTQVWDKI